MNCVLGIDFDNTIVSYSDIMHKTAVQWGLVDSKTSKNKKVIRDKIRALPDGKIQRIKDLGCTHFIDDLEEFFLEESFPNSVEKIFFAADEECSTSSGLKNLSTWRAIYEYFFNKH